MVENSNFLKINVGFIVAQTVGFSRDIPLDAPEVRLSDDLTLKDLRGHARVTRTSQGLLVQVQLAATGQAECVRCLTEFQQPLSIDFTDLWAFTPAQMTESGLLMPETGKINLAPIVREEMLLSYPINTVCNEDCKGLCSVCGENLNLDPEHHHEEE
jgi:uncharacterized protein